MSTRTQKNFILFCFHWTTVINWVVKENVLSPDPDCWINSNVAASTARLCIGEGSYSRWSKQKCDVPSKWSVSSGICPDKLYLLLQLSSNVWISWTLKEEMIRIFDSIIVLTLSWYRIDPCDALSGLCHSIAASRNWSQRSCSGERLTSCFQLSASHHNCPACRPVDLSQRICRTVSISSTSEGYEWSFGHGWKLL